MATIIATIFFSVLPIFHIHSIVSAMFCVSICEKQLLKLFMDLLKRECAVYKPAIPTRRDYR